MIDLSSLARKVPVILLHTRHGRAGGKASPPAICYYAIAGREVESDTALTALAPFAIPVRAHGPEPPEPVSGRGAPSVPAPAEEPRGEIFHGEVLLAGALRQARCEQHGLSFRLEVEGLGAVVVERERDAPVVTLFPAPDLTPDGTAWAELVAGPGLILPLTLEGVLCLHASAVLGPSGALVFFGASGQGKSTLAAGLGPELPRLADDILPLERPASSGTPSPVVALPHYPQLKLAAAQQVPVSAPARIPVAALFHLATTSAGEPLDTISARPLSPRAAVTALIESSVGPRVLGPEVLAAHLDFCVYLAAQLPIYRLTYPRRPDALPRVREVVTAARAAS